MQPTVRTVLRAAQGWIMRLWLPLQTRPLIQVVRSLSRSRFVFRSAPLAAPHITFRLQALVQCLANALGRDAVCALSGSQAPSQLLHVDFEAGGQGLNDVMLDLDQMCEELDRRKSP